MTAYPHAHALREGANTSARPRNGLFRGIKVALALELVAIELLAALVILAWRLAI